MIVTLCGSQKYTEYFDEFVDLIKEVYEENYKDSSNLAVNLCFNYPITIPDSFEFGKNDKDIERLVQLGAISKSFKNIDKSDVVVFCNAGGVMGASTTLELGYAYAKGKYIIFWQEDEELVKNTIANYIANYHIEDKPEDKMAIAESIYWCLAVI